MQQTITVQLAQNVHNLVHLYQRYQELLYSKPFNLVEVDKVRAQILQIVPGYFDKKE